MADPRRTLGDAAEDFVARWYVERGFEILARKWNARGGELDLVAAQGSLIVFVEVRSVSRRWLASPTVSVLPAKQARVGKAADQFLRTHDHSPAHIRFDVAGAVVTDRGFDLEVIENAFVPGWGY